MLTLIVYLFLAIPLMIINGIVAAVLWKKKYYLNRSYATAHALVMCLIPTSVLIVAIWEGSPGIGFFDSMLSIAGEWFYAALFLGPMYLISLAPILTLNSGRGTKRQMTEKEKRFMELP